MDVIHKTEYKVRDLNTLSVTLFPTRAQVSREIKGVELKRGTNEITIIGLSPTVDEDSIKVEGSGSATITDINIELLPNRELFEEVYPDSDEEQSDSEDPDSDSDEEEVNILRAAKDKVTDLKDALSLAEEEIASALKRLQILDDYGKMLDRKRNIVIESSLDTYKEQRAKAFKDHITGTKKQRELKEQIEKAARKVIKLQRQEDKKKAKANKEKEKVKKEKAKKTEIKNMRKEEVRKEKRRIRDEKEKFWPQSCYTVKITLEAAAFTPMSSRRASISSEIDVSKISVTEVEEKDDVTIPCDLVLSYVTSSAYWSPSYDLQLNTTKATASLYFDAMLKNFTSETWSNCKVTLSTSQTTFSGLDDAIPTLIPWRIKLANKHSGIYENDILRSKEEAQQIMAYQNWQKGNVNRPWAQMFPNQQQKKVAGNVFKSSFAMSQAAPPPPPPMQAMSARLPAPMPQANVYASQVPQAPGAAGGGLFGSAAPVAPSAPPPSRSLFGASRGAYVSAPPPAPTTVLEATELQPDYDEDQEQPDLDFQESLMEETGLTTTYDLPGLKTLIPKSAGSKQRVARVNFSSVIFSHTIVAKYKAVAYLKAKLKNTSKLTLLKGTAGLTLDGTFMGKTSLPRCSAGETFSLSLGVDPAIKVSYPKPDVRRASSGIFSKENSSVYVRTITLHNTRAAAGRAVSMLVLDQIPVSEDERLRVELVDPRGLSIDGSGVSSGTPGRDTKEDREWGKATTKLKKGGEVSWDVSLNAGKAVKLSLEYAVSMPSGDFALQC